MRGSFLLELVIVLGMIGVLLAGVIPISRHIVAQSVTSQLAQQLHYTRQRAIAYDQDISLTIADSVLIFTGTNGYMYRYVAPSSVSVTMNRTKLGFKNTGRPMNPGSITITTDQQQHKLSVGVGHGKISIK